MVFLGEISYSLYLYHYLGVTLAGSLDLGPDLARFAFAAAFGPLVATASYFLVERPLRAGSSRRSGLQQAATRTSTNLS